MNTRSKSSSQPAPVRPTSAPPPAKKSRKAKGKAKNESFEDMEERATRDIRKEGGSASVNEGTQRVVSKDLVGRLMSNRPGESSSAPTMRQEGLEEERSREKGAQERRRTRESLMQAVDYESEEETVMAGERKDDRGPEREADGPEEEAGVTEMPETTQTPEEGGRFSGMDLSATGRGSPDGVSQRKQQRDSPRPATNELRAPPLPSGTTRLRFKKPAAGRPAQPLPDQPRPAHVEIPPPAQVANMSEEAPPPRPSPPGSDTSHKSPHPRLLSDIEEEDEEGSPAKGISYADYDLESDFDMEKERSNDEYLMDIKLPSSDDQDSQDGANSAGPQAPIPQGDQPLLSNPDPRERGQLYDPPTTNSPLHANRQIAPRDAEALLASAEVTTPPRQRKRKHRRERTRSPDFPSPDSPSPDSPSPATLPEQDTVSGAWIKPKKTAKLREASKAQLRASTTDEPERKRMRSEDLPPPSPALAGPEDLLVPPRAGASKTSKRRKEAEERTARVPHKHSLRGPVVHKSNTLEQPIPYTPLLVAQVAAPAPQAGTSYATPTRHGGHGNAPPPPPPQMADAPTQKKPKILFSKPPPGGYAAIEGPCPMWPYINMEEYSKTYYGKVKTGKIMAIAFGYTFAETHSNLPAPLAGIAVEMISEYLHIDADTIETANPVSVPNPANPSLGPWGVLVHGFTRKQEKRLIKRKCLAANGVGVQLLAVEHHIPSQMINIRGPHNKTAKKIRHIVRQKLRDPDTSAALVQVAREALPGDARSDEELAKDIIKSVNVDRLEAHAKGGIKDPSYNVSLPPLCDRVDIWYHIHDIFTSIDYSSELGPAEITRFIRCLGCHSANHFGGLCTYDKSETWYGPPAGISAMSPKEAWEAKRNQIAAYLRDLRLL